MKFEDLDAQMRLYEQSLDQVVPSEAYMVARFDGRGFTRLTKEICDFEAPFDIRFRDIMVETLKGLMDCGFKFVYGFTESDEISLLFDREDHTYGRKVRKLNSTLAGTASALFSLQLGKLAVFDCRMIPLPSAERVRDYFLWRQEDANRNSLNSHCYWALRKAGLGVSDATAQIEGRSIAEKTELLMSCGVDFASLPLWQKRGVGVWCREFEKLGFNPKTQEQVKTTRKGLYTEYELPVQKEYSKLINTLLGVNEKNTEEKK